MYPYLDSANAYFSRDGNMVGFQKVQISGQVDFSGESLVPRDLELGRADFVIP